MIKNPLSSFYGDKPTIKDLASDIFANKSYSQSESKPIEKSNFGEPLNSFDKDKKDKNK